VQPSSRATHQIPPQCLCFIKAQGTIGSIASVLNSTSPFFANKWAQKSASERPAFGFLGWPDAARRRRQAPTFDVPRRSLPKKDGTTTPSVPLSSASCATALSTAPSPPQLSKPEVRFRA
jgi:hypothetical protein